MNDQNIAIDLDFALRRTAQIRGVAHWDWLPNDDLLFQLRALAPDAAKLYETFADAYIVWWTRRKEMHTGEGGNLADADSTDYQKLLTDRDSARIALQTNLGLV
ncbi:MAG: hypothetical protein ABL962_08590 [Fimbriimonadaceae bacterium]